MKKVWSIMTAFALSLLLFAGCAGDLTGDAPETADASSYGNDSASGQTAAPSVSLDTDAVSFTDRDSDASYDASSATVVMLSGADAEIVGSDAALTQGYLTLSKEGTYILTGNFSGCVIVDAPEEAKIQIVLAGVTLTSATGPAILIRQADKVFVTLAQGAENFVSDASAYSVAGDDENADAAIFSKADLTINGEGALTVTGNYKHGIVGKDDLVVTNGTIAVTSVSTAINGKNCVKISGGTFTLDAGTAGIKSDNEEEDNLGYVYISGGTFAITAGGKGIMGYAALEIAGGTFEIASADDALHTNGSLALTGGDFIIRAGDDGIHADADVSISGGTLAIAESYEGIEGANIYISGGTISLVSSDDGLNAAGGADSSGFGGAGGDMFAGAGNYAVVISGGYLFVNAQGDGLDSNGPLTISGGVTLVSGPTNDGNGALDDMSGGTITGGVLIAAGSSGMAQGFDESASTQCSMLVGGFSAAGGTRVTLCDGAGNVIATFIPEKDYSSVVVSAPSMSEGETYTLCTGGEVEGCDANGYASSGTLGGGTRFTSVEQSGIAVSSGSMGGFGQGGGMRPGGGTKPGGGGPGGN